MLRTKLFAATMASVIALGGVTAALAANHNGPKRGEKTAVLTAKVPLAQAIAAAEQHTKGRAIAVDIEKEKGVYRYEVLTIVDGRGVMVLVDTSTGSVVGTEREGFMSRTFDGKDKSEITKAMKATTTLAAAIAAAEQNTGGKATEASFESENSQLIYEVKVLKDNAVQKVKVDAMSGKILSTKASADDDNESED